MWSIRTEQAFHYCKYTLEKTEGTIKNEQLRDTSNIEHTRGRTKTNKKHYTENSRHHRGWTHVL